MSTEIYDVIVVGSGASGGWAAKRLSESGLKVALVDAGFQQSDSNFTEHEQAFKLKYRNAAPELIRKTRPVQKDCYACMEYNYDWFCNDLDEPYTTYPDMPFSWQGRMRVTGGRTNVWGRQSYRYSDLDFKAFSHDGYGVDWPLSYKDVSPYYSLVEKYVGITGIKEGVYELPDGDFQPPMGMSCPEQLLRSRIKEKFGRTLTLGRSANLTQATNGRAPCHYCGPCERGCVTHSYFNSYFTTVADAMKSGNCTHIANAMVYKVLTEPNRNRATGVLYIDRTNRQPKEVRGRVVALCAQSLESVRIMLNSANRQNPNGLGNSSGVLGHYLMDHITGSGAFGEIDNLPGAKANINGPNRPDGIYVIRFRNTHNGPQSKNFIRGYGYQGGGGVNFNMGTAGFGAAYKEGIKKPITYLALGGFGECLAREDNYIEIDPNVSDTFGIPVLRFHVKYGENERAMFKDIGTSAAEMLEAAGARNVRVNGHMNSPGWAIHELGVARMGNDPKTSVLNQFEQSHDVKNLFVLDGASFCSSACQNPTLTIMAICVRACDYMMQEMKKRNI
ncbi:MAG TPA: GMC family oxidoreductase [Terriglobia bacterium]|nr:GMC family oxidoreductase [Terriglobia bacterium]